MAVCLRCGLAYWLDAAGKWTPVHVEEIPTEERYATEMVVRLVELERVQWW